MEKLRLLTRNLMLNKKYLIIDEKEEVKSEIAEKEREDFLEDEELSEKEILKESILNKKHFINKKETFWESSDDENYNFFSESDQSISYDSENIYISTPSIHTRKCPQDDILGKSNSLLENIVPKGILKKITNTIKNEENFSSNETYERSNLSIKKVNFNLMKNTVNVYDKNSLILNYKENSINTCFLNKKRRIKLRLKKPNTHILSDYSL